MASPSRAAFPVTLAGRHPRLHFRGLLRLHSRYGPSGCSTAQGGLCHEASTRSVTQPRRSSATRPTDSSLGGSFLHWSSAPFGAYSAIRASVMGRWVSSPPSDLSRRRAHASVRGRHEGRHIMPSDGSRRANLGTRGPAWSAATPGFAASPDPASRRRDLGGATRSGLRSEVVSSRYAAVPTSLPQRKSAPSSHMRCRTVASLRARATLARFRPRRLATSMAQRFRLEKRTVRLSMIWAAS